MKYAHRTQFSGGTDDANRAAAASLVERLIAAGHHAEVDPEIPTAVDHDADEHDAAISEAENGAPLPPPAPDPAPAPDPEPTPEPSAAAPFTQEDPVPVTRTGRRKEHRNA